MRILYKNLFFWGVAFSSLVEALKFMLVGWSVFLSFCHSCICIFPLLVQMTSQSPISLLQRPGLFIIQNIFNIYYAFLRASLHCFCIILNKVKESKRAFIKWVPQHPYPPIMAYWGIYFVWGKTTYQSYPAETIWVLKMLQMAKNTANL